MLSEAAARNIALNLSALEDLPLFIEADPSPKFHLKVDTGMSRLGIPFNSVVDILQQIKKYEHLKCEGIYSHYATADEGELSYAEYQLEQFNQVLHAAKELDLKIKHIHFSNSGTVLNMHQTRFNLVRVGMLLYGAFPSDEVPMDMPIKPVMEFKGPVVALREVSTGTKVSYGGVWEATQDTIIGVIQTGFADGFPRSWYMDGYVGLRGKYYPIAGRVCMDQFMVDFGEADVRVGDEVLIFGQNDSETIRIEDIAQAIASTSYVLLTAIGGRTERIFIN
jgi:alanine racemase